MKLKKLIPIIGLCLLLATGAVLATISTEVTRIQYAGNDVTTVFPYTFKVFANTELQVIVRDSSGNEAIQTLTTHYSVSGVGVDAGGNVTMVTAPATGETLTILRNMPLKQLTDYVPGGRFPAESHEDALDKLTMKVQQLQEQLDRSIHVKKTSTLADLEFSEFDAGEYVRVNLTGDGLDSTDAVYDLGNFLQSGTGAVSRTAASKMGETVSVMDFSGVDPTGTTDSSAGIIAAYTAVGDGTVFFPLGTYLAKDLSPPAYCILEGEGKGTIIKAISNPTNAVIYINASNVVIKNLKIHGNSDNAVTAKGVSVASGGYSSKLERVFFSHFADDGLYVNNANDIKLDDCEFITMTGTQMINLSSATQCLIDKCRFQNSDVDYAILTAGATQGFNTAETVTVRNSWFEFTNANTIVDTIRLGHTPARILNNYFVVGSTNATHANHINVVAGAGTSGHVRIAMNDFHRKGATAVDITISANARDTEIMMNRIDDPFTDIVDGGQGTFFMGLMDYSTDAHGIIAKKLQLYERAQAYPAITFDLNALEILLHNANAQNLGLKQKTTLLSPMSGATHTWSNAIPAGSQVIGVSARVTTLIEGATTMDIGDGTDVDIFIDGMAVAEDTTADLANCNDGTLLPNTYKAATNIVVTALGGATNFSAGALRLTLYYLDLTPPTS